MTSEKISAMVAKSGVSPLAWTRTALFPEAAPIEAPKDSKLVAISCELRVSVPFDSVEARS